MNDYLVHFLYVLLPIFSPNFFFNLFTEIEIKMQLHDWIEEQAGIKIQTEFDYLYIDMALNLCVSADWKKIQFFKTKELV